ncbi:5-hydroxytryptamine receptor [Holothuria leucospilota]|uniref:5-hydroxytryptamine receptor n=1 Tax=Holothuria leucospilota TaxID=206669 RepID=A0A9Q1C471_HOLLE|nr:5-hydroxytryptamine receptor [Holothuria leucospilota]
MYYFFIDFENYQCDDVQLPQYNWYAGVALALMLFADFFMPFAVLFCLNAMVIYKLWKRSQDQLEQCIQDLGLTKKTLDHEIRIYWKRVWAARFAYIRNCCRVGRAEPSHSDQDTESDTRSVVLTDIKQIDDNDDSKSVDAKSELQQTDLEINKTNQAAIEDVELNSSHIRQQNNDFEKTRTDSLQRAEDQAKILLQRRLSLEHRRIKKTARHLFVFVLVFFLCWMPFYITATVSCFVPPSDALTQAQQVTSVILWSNSLVNPFLYAAMSQAYRDFLRRYILRQRGH